MLYFCGFIGFCETIATTRKNYIMKVGGGDLNEAMTLEQNNKINLIMKNCWSDTRYSAN
mgnify:FL=1